MQEMKYPVRILQLDGSKYTFDFRQVFASIYDL